MKLVSFSAQTDFGTVERIGSLRDDTIIDLTAAHSHLLAEQERSSSNADVLPTAMLPFLQGGGEAKRAAREAQALVLETEASTAPDGMSIEYSLDNVTLRSPLPRPNTLRDCTVYEDHLLNTRDLEPGALPEAYYEFPIYYNGDPTAVVAPDSTVPWPDDEQRFDYELEIAAVIGKQGRNISAEDSEEYVAGFTIFNDFSARDHQLETKSLKLGPGKSKDYASGLGPCLVTTDAIDPTALTATTRVNGDVWAEGSTDGMYHSWGEIIEYVSAGSTVHPGDVIGSGTIEGGCGLELDRWLEPGDTIELEVDGIGTLRHTLAEDADANTS